jgi:YebC/PmpR family DNA-binding regulatory protein
MSGHSKWSTIKRQKGAADIKRGLTFTKVANAITIAVKMGGSGDPESNPRLRMAMEAAKDVNMPNVNVARAIDRGLGKLPGQVLEEVVYEGFGPGKVAFLIEAVTDNKLRTLQEIKNLFERAGGSLAGTGAVSYMFEGKGEIKVVSRQSSAVRKDDEMLELIDLGAEDVEELNEQNVQGYLVYTEGSKLAEVGNKITRAGYTLESQDLVMKPNILQPVNDAGTAKKVIEFTEKLEEQDDIQKVYANFDIEE